MRGPSKREPPRREVAIAVTDHTVARRQNFRSFFVPCCFLCRKAPIAEYQKFFESRGTNESASWGWHILAPLVVD